MSLLTEFEYLNFFAGVSLLLATLKFAMSFQIYKLDIPLILILPVEHGLKQWRERYKFQSVAQQLLTLITSLSSISTFILMMNNPQVSNFKRLLWLLGCLLIISLGPYTVKIVFPINARLNSKECDNDLNVASNLLKRWGEVNPIRTFALFWVNIFFFISIYI